MDLNLLVALKTASVSKRGDKLCLQAKSLK